MRAACPNATVRKETGKGRPHRMRRRRAAQGITLAETLVALALLALLVATAVVAARGGLGCHRNDALRLRAEIGRTGALLMAALRDDLRSAASVSLAGDGLTILCHRAGEGGGTAETPVRYAVLAGTVTRGEGAGTRSWDFTPLLGADGKIDLTVTPAPGGFHARLAVAPAGWPEPVRFGETVRSGVRATGDATAEEPPR